MLCGDLKVSTFERFSCFFGDYISLRVSGFASTSGNKWGVITHQVEGHQHRFILPLWEARTADFIRAMLSTGFGFSLGCKGESRTLLFMAQRLQDLVPFLSLSETAGTPEMADWVKEMPMLISMLGRSEAIPSIVPKHRVLDVSISMVIPSLGEGSG
jgi:hypothetical protein